jgi:hypothetical protein
VIVTQMICATLGWVEPLSTSLTVPFLIRIGVGRRLRGRPHRCPGRTDAAPGPDPNLALGFTSLPSPITPEEANW